MGRWQYRGIHPQQHFCFAFRCLSTSIREQCQQLVAAMHSSAAALTVVPVHVYSSRVAQIALQMLILTSIVSWMWARMCPHARSHWSDRTVQSCGSSWINPNPCRKGRSLVNLTAIHAWCSSLRMIRVIRSLPRIWHSRQVVSRLR